MIFKIPYLISKHFCLPLFEFIIFHFLFILHSIHRFLLFRTFHFSFIQFPTFQFSNFSISLLLHISLLHICIYLSIFYHFLFTIILIIRFPLCMLNMQISFSTQQPFTFDSPSTFFFLNLRANSKSHLIVTKPASILKRENKIKLEKSSSTFSSWIERSITSSTRQEPVPGSKDSSSIAREADLTSRTFPKSSWRRVAGEKKRRNRSRYLEAEQGARNVSLPRASDDPPREKRSRISRADPLEVARAVALSERRQAALLRTQTTAASMLPLSLSLSHSSARVPLHAAPWFTLPSRPNFDRDRYWIRQTDLMVEMDLQWKRKIGRLIGETWRFWVWWIS